MKLMSLQSARFPAGLLAVTALAMVFVSGVGYAWYFADRIVPNTSVGSVAVGGLTKDEAAVRLQEALEAMDTSGVELLLHDQTETITAAAIGFDLNLADALTAAFASGHNGGALRRVGQRIAALWDENRLEAPARLDSRPWPPRCRCRRARPWPA
jgi:hypothetical protein